MTVQEQERLYSADELIERHLADDIRIELVRGELIEVPPAGAIHRLVCSFIHFRLYQFVETHAAPGYVTAAQGGYLLERAPDTVRAPDADYITKVRAGELTGGYFPAAPDLAVEVISPHDRAVDVQEKIDDYLRCGTRAVWAVYYKTRSVVVHTAEGAQTLKGADVLDGGDILPGFQVSIREIFAVLER